MLVNKLLLISCAMVLVISHEKSARGRKSRFISFDSEKEDVQVSLDFTIPFVSIPIKKAVHSMLGGLPGLAIPQINFNPSALAFGSLMILASSVLLPLFSKGFSSYETDHYYRVLDAEHSESNILMDISNQFLSVSRGCPLRIACWMSQKSDNGDSRRTIDQFIRNKLISSIVNTTAIEEAMLLGRKGHDCSAYEPCPIQEEYLPVLMRNFAILKNSKNVT